MGRSCAISAPSTALDTSPRTRISMGSGARWKFIWRIGPISTLAPSVVITRNPERKPQNCGFKVVNVTEATIMLGRLAPALYVSRIGGYLSEKNFQPPGVVHSFNHVHPLLCEPQLCSESKSREIRDFCEGGRD